MGALLDRFQGQENRPRLIEALAAQKLVANDAALAEALADAGALHELAEGEVLIEQGQWDDDLYFILAGDFDVILNGRPKSVRGPGELVGELSGAEPSRARTATLKARSESLVLKVSKSGIDSIAGANIQFWKRAMNVVAARLEERNSWIGQANEIPRVLIVSSKEGKAVMDEITINLDGKDIAVDTWDKGTFGISDYPISSLMDAIEAADFVVAVVRGDDVRVSRGKTSKIARDNVHLEYGISLGVLGRRRSLLLVCADDSLELPSDAAGLTTLRYSEETADDLRRSVRSACIKLREHILAEGVFVERRAKG
jgi:predicted nucleotide-binding protein